MTLVELAERLFGDMHARPGAGRRAGRFTGGVRNDRRELRAGALVPRPFRGSPPRDRRRIPALSLFVQALGGGTSSRLFQELREERGLAYSVYAWNQAFADVGLVGIGCAADRARAAESHRARARDARRRPPRA